MGTNEFLTGKSPRYKVKATQIVVQDHGTQGGDLYLRRGRLLPARVSAGEIARLLDLGLIELDGGEW